MTRIHVYLGGDRSRVIQAAKHRGVSVSQLTHAALVAFLDTDKDKREALILRRFDRLSRQLGKLDRDLTVLTETVALYVQYELAVTPPVPVSDQAAARAQARDRFAQFVERVARRLSEGRSLISQVVDEITPSEEDFFSLDLETDHEPNTAGDQP